MNASIHSGARKRIFAPLPDLGIGQIVEVSGTSFKVELADDVTELARTFDGRVYPIGQIGSIVKVHVGRRLVFGFVTLLRMRSEDLKDEAPALSLPPEADQRLMEVEMFGEGSWDQGVGMLDFSRGVATYPLPWQDVYLMTREEVAELYGAVEGARETGSADPLVPVATYVGSANAICRANIDKMFGMHCAVLGSTGSGKSSAVAAVLHGVLDHRTANGSESRPNIIIIDPHGEYASAFGDRAVVYRAYDPIANDDSEAKSIRLPYWLMSADEFRSLVIGKTEHEATSQNNVVYKALAHARMVALELIRAAPSSFGDDPPAGDNPIDEPRALNDDIAPRVANFDCDKPYPFHLEEFAKHVRFLQGGRIGKANKFESRPVSELTAVRSVLSKLQVLRNDARIRFLMEEWNGDVKAENALAEILQQLVGPDQRNVRIVDLSGLPNEVAGPLTAMIARLLFQYKLHQSHEERKKDPILLVCEEAHRYVPNQGEAQYAAAQSAIRRIAREGRKYGLGLMLVSQRPADIESTVLAQCGTWLVLRLTNSADQRHVATFLPDSLAGMVRALPALAQREALFVGEGAAIPARVRITQLRPDQLPKSNTVSFAAGWQGRPLEEGDIRAIANRMAPSP